MDDGPQCTCEKSGCLQRYCHCFEARYYCNAECSCHSCRNTRDNADEVDERAESILKKKPDAFKPKVTAGAGDGSGLQQQLQQQQQEAREHVKGCNCRKSECKKLYCECFKHRVGCSAKCHCIGCANKFGVKGLAAETDTESPTGISGGSGATLAGPTFADDNMFNAPAEQASMVDVFSPIPAHGDWSWSDDFFQRTRAMGDGGLEEIFQQLKGGDNFQHNVDPQIHQGFAQADGPPNDTDSPTGTSGGSGATLAGSDGASSIFVDDNMLNAMSDQPNMVDVFAPISVPGDWSWSVDFVPRTRAMGDGGLEEIFQQLKGGDNFQHNIDPQIHQGFAQADGSPNDNANSMPHPGPSNSDT